MDFAIQILTFAVKKNMMEMDLIAKIQSEYALRQQSRHSVILTKGSTLKLSREQWAPFIADTLEPGRIFGQLRSSPLLLAISVRLYSGKVSSLSGAYCKHANSVANSPSFPNSLGQKW